MRISYCFKQVVSKQYINIDTFNNCITHLLVLSTTSRHCDVMLLNSKQLDGLDKQSDAPAADKNRLWKQNVFCFLCVAYHSQCCIIPERLTLSPPGVERSHCQSRTPVTVSNCVYCTVAWHVGRKCSQHWNTSQPLKTCLPEWVRMRRCKTCQGHSSNPSPTPLYLYLLTIIMLFLLWLLPYFITLIR